MSSIPSVKRSAAQGPSYQGQHAGTRAPHHDLAGVAGGEGGGGGGGVSDEQGWVKAGREACWGERAWWA